LVIGRTGRDEANHITVRVGGQPRAAVVVGKTDLAVPEAFADVDVEGVEYGVRHQAAVSLAPAADVDFGNSASVALAGAAQVHESIAHGHEVILR
jgi:hypothetical protein